MNKHTPLPRIAITQNPQGRRTRKQGADTLHFRKTGWGVVYSKWRACEPETVASSLPADTGMVTRVEF